MPQKPLAVFAAAVILTCIANTPVFADPAVVTSNPNPPSPEQTKALMAPYRERIDTLDAQIVALLGKRFDVIHEVAVFKAEHGIHPIQPARIEEVVQHARAQAQKAGVDPDLIEKLYRVIIQKACDEEEEYARKQEAKTK